MTRGSRTGTRHAAVIVNPVKVDVALLRDHVERAALAEGWGDTRWFETTVTDAGAAAAGQALSSGPEMVLAAGGDGTVRAVAGALRGSRTSLGIIPVGTGNLLARNLRIPMASLDAAVSTAFTGVGMPIDVGIAHATDGAGNTRSYTFTVMAGMGIDAAMMANTNSSLKKRVGWLAYVDGGVRSLPKLRKVRMRFAVDGGTPHGAQLSTILVGNCGKLPGGIEMFPDADVADGRLDIAVLQPKTVFGWLLVGHQVLWENRVLRRSALGRSLIKFAGNGDKPRTITYLRGKDVIVTVREPQPFEVDGDAVADVTELRFSVDPRSLIVRVPHTPDARAARRPQAASSPT